MRSNKEIIFIMRILVLCLALVFLPGKLRADTAEQKYYKAEACWLGLEKNEKKRQYRSNWLPCISQFREAYERDKSGRFAAASLFMAGKLWRDLYSVSFKSSDKAEARRYFRLVVEKFPKSLYKPKAQTALKSLGSSKTAVKKAETKKSNPAPQGKIKKKVREKAYVESKARYRAALARKRTAKKSVPQKRKAGRKNGYPSEKQVTVSGLRVWSNPSYTRIVIDANGETTYTHDLLDKDLSANKPQRLYVDFDNSRLGGTLENIIPINDDLLSNARAAQYKSDSVRVVIDIKSFKTYKIFSLRKPFRTIIDVWGRDVGGSSLVASKASKPANRKKPKKEKKWDDLKNNGIEISKQLNLGRQLNLGVKRIVIDPGHGGRDVGAVGPNKVYEKDIVLKIAKRLARKIKSKLGCEVILTRSTDRFLSLEERTAIANSKSADLFISIHTNSHKSSRAYGIETYILSPKATDEDAIRVAQRENADSRNNMSDLEAILINLMQTSKIDESSRLATYVQRGMVRQLDGKYNRIKNKGVKQALFYVLIGASMPSILVETSFISNKRECGRLKDPTYQDNLCDGILKGIRRYMRETSSTAFSKKPVGGFSG